MTDLHSAWQAALAAEHEAVFGYGLLGPHVTGSDEQLAISCSSAHEALRDATEADLAGVGLTPVAPAPDYPTLYPVRNPAAARALAVRIEDACAAAWRYLYLAAASTSEAPGRVLRGAAQHALVHSAVRAARWRARATPQHATRPFPGT